MLKIWRLIMVFIIGGAAFLVAINRLNRPPFGSCQQSAERDPSYAMAVDPTPNVILTRYRLTITHRGLPIDPSLVCMRADMGGAGGMSGMGLVAPGVPVGPGVYEVPVRFIMGGYWQGAVLVQQPQGNVEIPFHFIVGV